MLGPAKAKLNESLSQHLSSPSSQGSHRQPRRDALSVDKKPSEAQRKISEASPRSNLWQVFPARNKTDVLLKSRRALTGVKVQERRVPLRECSGKLLRPSLSTGRFMHATEQNME